MNNYRVAIWKMQGVPPKSVANTIKLKPAFATWNFFSSATTVAVKTERKKGSTAPSSQTYFRSSAQRDMVHSMTRLDIQNRLSKRFNVYGQLENTVILSNQIFKNVVLSMWANIYIEYNPADPMSCSKILRPGDTAHLEDYDIYPPTALLENPEIKSLREKDITINWILERLSQPSTNDCIPLPVFPSVLRFDLPQFPFEPLHINHMGDYFGLLKWPYRRSLVNRESNRSIYDNGIDVTASSGDKGYFTYGSRVRKKQKLTLPLTDERRLSLETRDSMEIPKSSGDQVKGETEAGEDRSGEMEVFSGLDAQQYEEALYGIVRAPRIGEKENLPMEGADKFEDSEMPENVLFGNGSNYGYAKVYGVKIDYDGKHGKHLNLFKRDTMSFFEELESQANKTLVPVDAPSKQVVDELSNPNSNKFQYHSSRWRTVKTGCSEDYIYSPSETETGFHREGLWIS